jgi:hypothetical protein
MKNFLFLLIFSTLIVGCGDDGDGSASSSASGITISGQMSLSSAVNVQKYSALGIQDYTVYCVAFNASATSCSDQLDSEGNFSCAGIPADTAFGCFVKDATSIVAALEFTDSTTGFENETTSSVALTGSVSLGSVSLNTTTGKATVSKSVLDGKKSTVESKVSVTDLQNTSWELTCVNTGDTVMDAACSAFVTESSSVFFRIITATKGETTMYGMGVWASQSAFQGCGSIDMTTTMKNSVETEDGITFTSISHGSAFTNDHGGSGTCKTESGSAPTEANDIDNYFSLQKLSISGNLYTLHEDDEWTNGGCTYTHTLSVNIEPSSSTELYGAFSIVEKESGSGCADEEKAAQFSVKFTKQ